MWATHFSEGSSFASVMPNPYWCFVSSLRAGYRINLERPADWYPAPGNPVLHIAIVGDRPLLLLNSIALQELLPTE